MPDNLRIVILTGSGCTIVTPLLEGGFQLVGIADVEDELTCVSFARRCLDTVYWKWLKRKTLPYLSCLANKNNIPYFDINCRKLNNLKIWLSDLKPDVMVCHSAVLLAPEIFNIPKYGTINIHPSLLPKYRGANPHFWFYYNMDMTAGVTLHFIDEHIDTGDIISQSAFPIALGQKFVDVRQILLYQHAIPLLKTALQILRTSGRLATTKQRRDDKRFPYARRLSNTEYMQTVGFDSRPLDHVWHVLHATEQWRDCILPHNRFAQCYQWGLTGRRKAITVSPFGVLDKDKYGYFITHKEGKIRLSRTISLRGIIKALLGML